MCQGRQVKRQANRQGLQAKCECRQVKHQGRQANCRAHQPMCQAVRSVRLTLSHDVEGIALKVIPRGVTFRGCKRKKRVIYSAHHTCEPFKCSPSEQIYTAASRH
jgi:hypothetical protein